MPWWVKDAVVSHYMNEITVCKLIVVKKHLKCVNESGDRARKKNDFPNDFDAIETKSTDVVRAYRLRRSLARRCTLRLWVRRTSS